ncbi:hypothetical protein SAMN05892883_3437 [Jatrophihabitans sp. GAS493]|uniref:DUF692 domain-containing protein n=1 Tax=Jatrophihabitans sp. GAS493 TaxID=1907575 RepID=UPI000BB6809F|nr:DUF692 domain-containing protein [Jatrophihabitans sp. GAS493]SOD74255.1 hypothetical protein SAMN05892883_3437 [Jatrophihabitans sp. GAS493]
MSARAQTRDNQHSRAGLQGVGIGWRPEISGAIARLPDLGFVEVIAESLPHGRRAPLPETLQPELTALLEAGVTVVPHGIGLSLGGAEPVDARRVAHLARCAELVGAPLVSEHVAFVRADDLEAGHLLPIPRTRESLAAVTRNIRRTQRELPVPLAVENIAALFEWPNAEFSESEFLAAIVAETGVRLVLDVANLYANAVNAGLDPAAELEHMPLEHVAYCHVAGGAVIDGLYQDTHTNLVPPEVLRLVTAVAQRSIADRGEAGAFMLERDGHYPPEDELRAEFQAIRIAASEPLATPQAPAR